MKELKGMSLVLFVIISVSLPYVGCALYSQHKNYHLLPQPPNCGVSSVNDAVGARVWGGEEAKLGEFPWAVYIRIEVLPIQSKDWSQATRAYCTGTLISDRYVLTAAHCFQYDGMPEYRVNVSLGEWDVTTDPDRELETCAPPKLMTTETDIIPHPESNPITLDYDVALIRLKKQIRVTDAVFPVCLPIVMADSLVNQSDYDYEKVTSIGWGKVNPSVSAAILKKVTATIQPTDECAVWWTPARHSHLKIPFPYFHIGDNPESWILCVQEAVWKTTCKGDSGSPALIPYYHNKTSTTVQVALGVLSLGDECFEDFTGQPHRPLGTLFIYIDSFMDWLLDTIRE